MLKRAALARAIALDPELLFLDEPTSGLDPASAAGVDTLILQTQAASGATVVIVSHDLDLLWRVCRPRGRAGRRPRAGAGHDGRTGAARRPHRGGLLRAAAGCTGPGLTMDDKTNYTLVGAFVLGLGAALVAGVLWLAAGWGGQQAMDSYQAVIRESVSGLNVDAPVKYLGVDVGKVSAHRHRPAQPAAGAAAFPHRARHADPARQLRRC